MRGIYDGEVIERVVGCMADGVSVNLVGRRGSGRSETAGRVVDLIGDAGVLAVRVQGIRALRERPLAALTMSGLDLGGLTGPSSPAAVVDGLVRLVSGRPSIVVVDDADDLDPVSVGALVAARARVSFAVLSTSRLSSRRRFAPGDLVSEVQPGVRIVLEPLRFEQVHQLVHLLLPGSVAPATVARVANTSGGLPGLVRAVVDHGRRTGSLRVVDGLWSAPGSLWAPELSLAVDPLLVDLEDDDLDALTLLATAGTVSLDTARHLVPWASVTRLDDNGLLQVYNGSDGPVVGVFPPLLAEHLRAESSVTRLAEVRRRLAESGAATRAVAPAKATTASLLADAPLLSQRIAEYWKVERSVLRLAWEHDRSPATAVPLLLAMYGTSVEPSEIESVADQTVIGTGDERGWALLEGWRAVFRAMHSEDLDGAHDRLESVRASLPAYDGFLRGTQQHLQFVLRSVPEIGSEMLDDSSEPLNAENLVGVQIEVHLAQGRIGEAVRLLDSYEPVYPAFVNHAQVCRGLAMVLSGDVDAGVEWAQEHLASLHEHLDPGPLQAHAYVAALGLALAGRFEEFDEVVAAALALSNLAVLQQHYQAGLLSLAAIVAGWQGRASYARSLAVQTRALGHRAGPFPAMVPGTLLALARGGPQPELAEDLWRAATERLDGGYVAAGVVAAVASLERRPDPARAAALAEAVAGTDSPLLLAFSEYATAASARDTDGLTRASTALRAAGTHLYAVRALVTRALVLRAGDDRDAACAQAAAAWEVAQAMGPERDGLFASLTDDVDLTTREMEIAELLAGKMSTAEIAHSLTLSTRTVESHLMNTFRKVGVDNRDDLVRAVTTWLGGAR